MKEFLDNFAAVVGSATLALLLFAVCHEYGYFWVIGSQFQTFVSTTDYFTNSTQWVIFAGLVLYTWLDWRAMFGASQYAMPIGRDWRTWMFPLIVILPLLLVMFFSRFSFDIGLLTLFAYIWLVYGSKTLPFAGSSDPTLSRLRAALLAAPLLAMAAFFAGKQRAESALAVTHDPYKLKIKGGEERNRILLRSFDKGLLVRSPADERVEFIRWDQIEEVTKPSPKDRGESYSCLLLRINCVKEALIP